MDNNRPERIEYARQGDSIVPVYTTDVVSQPYGSYTQDEHALWGEMMVLQRERLQGMAVESFFSNMDKLHLVPERLPNFEEISGVLRQLTGWELVAVNGLLPANVFFGHLAHRRFPVTWWLRSREQRDYIEEPDLFHDLFGHVPMLADERVARFIEAYGKAVLEVENDEKAADRLMHLYWYTVEFGLTQENGQTRIFGAGILSSPSESLHSLSDTPTRVGFDARQAMARPYRIDQQQQHYFVLSSLDELLELDPKTLVSLAREAGQEPSPAGEGPRY